MPYGVLIQQPGRIDSMDCEKASVLVFFDGTHKVVNGGVKGSQLAAA